MRNIIWYTFLVFSITIITGCANSISPPQGGPKDVTPPEVVESIPKNGSANFETDRFSIRFNEFVKLENIQQAALISPPMKNLPDFKVKGKTVQVKFNEELKPNTTYSIYFGDAITDITENNPISNFTYIFSTGDYVDSLSLYGIVLNSFNLLPVEGAFVMLYKDDNDTIIFDSLPLTVPPYYLSKTNEEGRFQFTGLSNEKFKLFSLMDQNSNFYFDQPGEEIAFLDTLVSPFYLSKPDTALNDTLIEIIMDTDSILVKDSVPVDSTIIKQIQNNSITLMMFLSPDTVQRLLKSEVLEKNKIQFSFSQPAENAEFIFDKYPIEDSLIIKDYSKNSDTIVWYLKNPEYDSVELTIIQSGDTLGMVYLKLDPVNKNIRGKKKDKPTKQDLGWKSNISGNVIKLNQKLLVKFSQPMVHANDVDSSVLISGTDTIYDPEFKFTNSLLNEIEIPLNLKEDTPYSIHFPDSAFTSWNNIHTSAINIKFSTKPISDYGILSIDLQPEIEQSYIVQLLNDKEEPIGEYYTNYDTTLVIEYLLPATYKLKVTYDDNGNKIWDTGNYLQKLQPEKIIYFEKEISIRANWEIEEKWIF